MASPKTEKGRLASASLKAACLGVPPTQSEIEAEKMDFIQQCFDKGMTEEW